MSEVSEGNMTFWEHLDELRKVIFRASIAVLLIAVVAFLNKDILFEIVLAPQHSDFITYRLICRLGEWLNMPSICPDAFQSELINTQLAAQFLIHISVSLYAGLLIASPYIIYLLFSFIKPALHANERRHSGRIITASFVLFFIGVLLSYFLIFPLSFRFLATYQVNELVKNTITLSSYISTLTILSLMLGAVFEIPILAYFFAKLGFINTNILKKYRRHALVVILIIAAFITPTGDALTLMLVSAPMYLLYELSIAIVKRTKAASL
ncbi:MAG: twin-arginine translocase subunit TatC [Culturomica sp.]|jgi:sec-independent protein translocase protein TatC|nr:twin-arginine translocase subunit TatC [Culturomica sp.]